jgi:preprotein translocase subunit SecB
MPERANVLFNLGHNVGEANNLAVRQPCGRLSRTMADCGVRPRVIATTAHSGTTALPGFKKPGSRRAFNPETMIMADENNTPAKDIDAAEEPKSIEARVLGQFIKDLSFENPNIGKLLTGPGETPNIKLEINVAAKRLQPDLYESAIDFKAVASNAEGTIYDLELVYAGLFQIRNIPDQALEPFLLINCPTLIFPFLRRLVADITREGGFPPLMLDPIDFAQLFMRRKQELAAASASGKPN